MRKAVAIAAIALGSFVSFALEPLVGRTLLAPFGGTAAVWMTCLTAFQVLLVAGYFYAHVVCARRSRGLVGIHLLLLCVAAAWCLGVAFHGDALTAFSGLPLAPALKTLLAVLAVSAVPFVVLSANSSLVQVLADNDYRLYAVSNVGSVLGLLAYPFAIEPFLSIPAQWTGVAGGLILYAALLLVLSLGSRSAALPAAAGSAAQPTWRQMAVWFGLSAAGVWLLNAVTAHMTGNVAPIPLLWALLLAIYLLTFVVGFGRGGEFLTPLWCVLALASAFAAVAVFRLDYSDNQAAFLANLSASGALLLFGGLCIHSNLYARRPSGAALTRYYLLIALGGAAGGIASGLAVPLVSSWIVEYPVAVLAVAALSVYGRAPLPKWGREAVRELGPNFPRVQLGLVALAAFAVWVVMFARPSAVLDRGRTFYGAWRVVRGSHPTTVGTRLETVEFMHGGTIHGVESADERRRDRPTAYYGPRAGGFAFTLHPDWGRRGIRAGLVGMGIGTLAWYERPQDAFDFFEICPDVIRVANDRRYFDFLANRRGSGRVIEGDARPLLEAQRAANEPKYDVIVVDAYSGDSIPYHLVTREAFRLYADRLAEGGVLALHITNWHIDLFPVVKAAARELGLKATVIEDGQGLLTIPSNWAFLSARELDFPDDVPRLVMDEIADVPLPTDAKGSLVPFVKWR